MKSLTAPGIVALGLLLVPGSGRAQSYEQLVSARQYRNEENMSLSVSFAVGTFTLGPDATGSLYRANLVYDSEVFRPIQEYNSRSHTLALGVRSRDRDAGLNIPDLEETRQRLDVSMSPLVPTDLSLRLGAGAADIELGGLSLASLRLESGATISTVNFSSRNRILCEEMELTVGAARFSAIGLGNSRCQHIEFHAGAGEFVLDFSGDLAEQSFTDVEVRMGLATLELRLPSSVGVAIELARFLAGFDSSGLEKRGSLYYSANYETADAQLRIDINAIVGSIDLVWLP